MSIEQILAVVIFLAMFALIVWGKFERHHITIVCGILTMVLVFGITMHDSKALFENLNISSIFTASFWYSAGEAGESSVGINWSTIIFIAGMMVMVDGMANAGFFRWLCMRLAKLVNYKVIPLFIAFMLMSAFLAMFIDSITVILFLASITFEIARLLNLNPVPMILAEIFCANLGGFATMCGDPPNIIVGTSLGFSFGDFITNTGVIAGVCLIIVVIYYCFIYRKWLNKANNRKKVNLSKLPSPESAIKNKRDFIISCFIFACAVVMLVTHEQTGLTVAFIGTFIAVITLITSGKDMIKIIKRVDYKTLSFFIGLFIVIGGLEQTGILELIADFIGKVSQGNILIMIAIIIWVSAIASAVVDNIPFAATMIPVIKALAIAHGVNLATLAWALSIGTDIGGSATPIGASANVVGTSVAEQNGHPIGWKEYCKTSAPATIIVVAISMVFIFIRYCM